MELKPLVSGYLGLRSLEEGVYKTMSRKSKSKDVPVDLFIPPQELSVLKAIQELDLELIPDVANEAQRALILGIEEDWVIAGRWIAYERFPCIDIRRYPYNTPKFRARRSWARVLNAQLNLCKGCFEGVEKLRELYSSPLDFGIQCMTERKQLEVASIFKEPKVKGDSTRSKDAFESGMREFLKMLRDGRVSAMPNHHKRLFQTAIALVVCHS